MFMRLMKTNFHYRYADEIGHGDQVLVRENDQLKAAVIKEISTFEMQGSQNLNVLSLYDVL